MMCKPPFATGDIDGEVPCTKKCASNCEQCETTCAGTGKSCMQCKRCSQGFYLNNEGICQSCNQNEQDARCMECETKGKCLKCSHPYTGMALPPQEGRTYYQCKTRVCPLNQYPAQFTDQNSVYLKCQPCHSACLRCFGNQTNQCLKCKKGFYLSQSQCLPNIVQTLTRDLIVKASGSGDVAQEDGTTTKPFTDLLRAIQYAKSISMNYQIAKVNIFMSKQDHFMISPLANPAINLNLQLHILPLQCSQLIDGAQHMISQCFSDTTSKVKIYNKIGGWAQIGIGQSFEMTRVVIDSSDSLAYMNGDTCSSQKQRCCMYNTLTGLYQNIVPTANCTVTVSDTIAEYGSSLFSFDLPSQRTVEPSIKLVQCEFTNFIYPHLSLIDLRGNIGKVIVTDSKFIRFTPQGSIISNMQLEEVPHPIASDMGEKLITKIVIRTSHFQVTSSCQSCTSISIVNSDFMELMYTSSFVQKQIQNLMGNRGKVLNLDEYSGNVVVKGSKFTENQFKIKDCKVSTGQTSSQGLTKDQRVGMMYMNKPMGALEFINNQFTMNSGFQLSQIHIDSHQTQPIILTNNRFIKNSAVLSPSALHISSAISCGSIVLSNNHFEHNINCIGTTEAHLMLLTCTSPQPSVNGQAKTSPSGVSYNTKQLLISTTNLTQNFFDGKPMVSVEKFPDVVMEDTTLIGNVASIMKEAFIKHSSLKIQSNSEFISLNDHPSIEGAHAFYFSHTSDREQTKSIRIVKTYMRDLWDIAVEGQSLNKSLSIFRLVTTPNSVTFISDINLGEQLGLTKALLGQYTGDPITETAQFLQVGNKKIRKGIHGPYIQFEWFDDQGTVTLEKVTITKIKVFMTNTSYKPEKALLYKIVGNKYPQRFTVKDIHVTNMIECNQHTSNFIVIQQIPQTGVHTVSSVTYTDICMDDTTKLTGSAAFLVIYPWMNNHKTPFSRIIVDQFKCLRVRSAQIGCLHLMDKEGAKITLNRQYLTINNSEFRNIHSYKGAVHMQSQCHHEYLAIIDNTIFAHNVQTDGYWSADLIYYFYSTQYASLTLNRCQFLNSTILRVGRSRIWGESMQLLSLPPMSRFYMYDTLFDGLRQPYYSSYKETVLNYITINQTYMLSSTVVFPHRVSTVARNITFQNYHQIAFGCMYLMDGGSFKGSITVLNVTSMFSPVFFANEGTPFIEFLNLTVINTAQNQKKLFLLENGKFIIRQAYLKNIQTYHNQPILELTNDHPLFQISNAVFENIVAPYTYFMFAESQSSKENYMRNVILKNITTRDHAIFSFKNNELIMDNVTVIDSLNTKLGLMISTSKSVVTIKNCRFTMSSHVNTTYLSKTGWQGRFMWIESGTIKIDNTHFVNGIGHSGGSISGTGVFTLEITNSNFINSWSKDKGGVLYLENQKTLTMKNVTIDGCGLTNYGEFTGGSAVYAQYNIDMTLEDVTIKNCTNQLFYVEQSQLKADRLKVLGAQDVKANIQIGGVIQSIDNNVIQIQNSVFQGSKQVERGGAVALIQRDPNLIIPNDLYVRNTTFRDNEAELDGGGIYVENLKQLSLIGNRFYNNKVTGAKSRGGGLCLISQNVDYIKGYVMDSTSQFIGNQAENVGAGIYFNYYAPKNPNNQTQYTMRDNYAKVYGNNIASYASKLGIIDQETYRKIKSGRRHLNNSQTPGFNSPPKLQAPTIANQQSGGIINALYIALLDQRGYVVQTDDISQASISIPNDQPNNSSYSPAVKDKISVFASKGVFVFDEAILVGGPNLSFNFEITSNGIDYSLPDNANLPKESSLKIKVDFRGCNLGEQFKDTGECVKCSDTHYLIKPSTSPNVCKSCGKTKMNCYGGNKVAPAQGFWRSSIYSDNFIQCLNFPACLGSSDVNFLPTGYCESKYQGFLCSQCQKGYSRNPDYTCSKCSSLVQELLRSFGLIIFGTLGVVIMVRSTLRDAVDQKKIQSVYIKILMNHVQLIALLITFDFRWSKLVISLLNTFSFTSSMTTRFLSVDCIFETMTASASKESNGFYFYALILYMALPFVLLIITLAFWFTLYLLRTIIPLCKKESKSQVVNKVIATIIILLFLSHPNIVNKMMDSLNCMEIDGEMRLISKMEVVCYKSRHLKWVITVSISSLVIWGLGIPLMAAVLVFRERKHLKKVHTMQKYGFLFKGYKRKYFFWETILMYRKILVIFIAVNLKEQGQLVQALIVMLLMVIFMFINRGLNPFMTKALNTLETISILSILITVYCGLYFLSDHPEIYNSPDPAVKGLSNGVQLSDHTKNLLFVVILLSNMTFIFHWGRNFLDTYISTFIFKHPKIATFLFFCANKTKATTKIKKKQDLQDHEIGRQDFEVIIENLRLIYETRELELNDELFGKLKDHCSLENILSNIKAKEQVRRQSTFKRTLTGANKFLSSINSPTKVPPTNAHMEATTHFDQMEFNDITSDRELNLNSKRKYKKGKKKKDKLIKLKNLGDFEFKKKKDEYKQIGKFDDEEEEKSSSIQ